MSKYLNSPSMSEMIYSLLLQQSNNNILPSGVMWFLFTLFNCAFLTYFAIRVFKLRPIYFLLFALVLKAVSGVFTNAYFLALDTTSQFLFFFVLGYYFDKYVIYEPIHKWKYLAWFIVAYLFLLVTYFNLSAFPPAFVAVFKFIKSFEIFGILVTLIIFGIAHKLAEKYSESKVLRWFIYCGASSMLIYVFHMPTFTLLNLIMNIVHVYPGVVKLLLLFVPGVIFPLIYGKILSYNKAAYKLLIGRDPG